jgi:transcriptional regulator with XRE-family HTH domain
LCDKTGEKMSIGKQIRKRRKELKMSVDELARRIGKDRSTVYRYETGDIGNMPIDILPPMIEALETTPQELLSTIIASNESLSRRAEIWFDATEGYEFNDEEMKVFYEVAKYFMKIRDSEDYQENMNALFTLFKQLNK